MFSLPAKVLGVLTATVLGAWVPALAADPLKAKPCAIKIRTVVMADAPNAYPLALLQMALAKTEAEYGPCQITMMAAGTHSRNIRLVLKGELDVIWNVATIEREKTLRPILIPIFQGLHGYRILLIRAGDEARFAKMKTLEELRLLTGGQMHDWQSTEILAANKLKFDTADRFDDLFTMLVKGRFDYFPRALHEPVSELQQRSGMPLKVEATLMLHYVAPDYFFVRPDATALAERIRLGFERGIADGTRDALREKIIGVGRLVKQFQISKRRVIELINPTLPAIVPLGRPEYWLDLKQFPE
ncbi:MAG: hypothetical protein NTZ90_09270 [Proteobacteria bacterium]|nr:hypothetical protein [Pseudomonadota bacterium]